MDKVIDRKVKWDFDSVKQEAAQYKTRTAFTQGSPGAYAAAARRGWLPEVCDHMPKREKKPNKKTKWDKEAVLHEAKKHESYSDFRQKARSAYVTASGNGWLPEVKSIWGG